MEAGLEASWRSRKTFEMAPWRGRAAAAGTGRRQVSGQQRRSRDFAHFSSGVPDTGNCKVASSSNFGKDIPNLDVKEGGALIAPNSRLRRCLTPERRFPWSLLSARVRFPKKARGACLLTRKLPETPTSGLAKGEGSTGGCTVRGRIGGNRRRWKARRARTRLFAQTSLMPAAETVAFEGPGFMAPAACQYLSEASVLSGYVSR